MMLLYHEPGVDAGENAKGELWWGSNLVKNALSMAAIRCVALVVG